MPAAQVGDIAGHVTDMASQPLPGVTITIVPERGGMAQQTISGDGTYRFDAISEDTYRVDFEVLGFNIARRNHVGVRSEGPVTVNATLTVSSVCECIRFSADTAPQPLVGQVVNEAS